MKFHIAIIEGARELGAVAADLLRAALTGESKIAMQNALVDYSGQGRTNKEE